MSFLCVSLGSRLSQWYRLRDVADERDIKMHFFIFMFIDLAAFETDTKSMLWINEAGGLNPAGLY